MTTNSCSIDCFCEELRGDPRFSELADQFHAGLTEVDRLADDSPDLAEFWRGLQHIFTRQSRPLSERINKLIAFNDLRIGKDGLVVVDLVRFAGW
jgi:hypothetical protein